MKHYLEHVYIMHTSSSITLFTLKLNKRTAKQTNVERGRFFFNYTHQTLEYLVPRIAASQFNVFCEGATVEAAAFLAHAH